MELEAGSQRHVYQVSYSEENVGKMMKHSKVRVTWNFVSHGGIYHEIALAWSKTTGKQEIRMDGAEIWFGRNQGRSVLDHHWTTSDESLKLHVLATCAPKMNQGFRSYVLLINGQLFASLPHHHNSERYSRDGSAHTPLSVTHDHNNGNSIMQILYPEGYTPPVDKHQSPRQRERSPHTVTAHRDSMVVTLSSGNGAAQQQPPMVDLLM